MYSITLTDGTEISGLTMNGNHFISESKIERKTFTRNLTHITITSDNLYPMDGDPEAGRVYDDPGYCGEYTNMKLVLLEEYKGGSWFILREPTKTEQALESLSANVDYLLMMQEEA